MCMAAYQSWGEHMHCDYVVVVRACLLGFRLVVALASSPLGTVTWLFLDSFQLLHDALPAPKCGPWLVP